MRPQMAWYAAKCIGCGICVKVCPTGAIAEAGAVPKEDICTLCGVCAKSCPTYALEKLGTEWEADELAGYLEKDRQYFESSGGGVTLSGGEPLLQWEFALDLIGRLRKLGIHTAVETCGYTSSETFRVVVEEVDLIIMDLKHHNNQIHRNVTGVENKKILENFQQLAISGKPCIIRTPVIPGVNDTPEDIYTIAEIASQAKGLLYYELLPYHALGTGKLESLGKKENCKYVLKPPGEEQMERLREAARSVGIEVK